MHELGTVKQAAGICGISEKYAYTLCHNGKLPAVQIGSVWRVNLNKLREQLGLKKENDAYESV